MRAHLHQDGAGRPVLDLRRAARVPVLPDLPTLSADEVAMAARTWRGRMVNEHVSASVFAGLVPQLMRATGDASTIAELPTMIADELRHAEQCAGVVVALGHDPVAHLPAVEALPQHADCGPLEGVLRNVLSVCCLSETVAVSVIRAEQAELEGTALGAVLASILADEVQHARFGWRLLGQLAPGLDAVERARVSRYLVDALAHQIRWELPKLPLHAGLRPELSAAGVCDGSLAQGLFWSTMDEVIVPALTDAGLDAGAAWAEAKRRAA